MRFPGLIILTLIIVVPISSPITVSFMKAEMVKPYLLAQTENPSARFLPGMVYDPVNEHVMLFGGGYDIALLGDTWVFNYETRTWTELELATFPTPRHSHGMVFDSNNEVIILFGGYNGTSPARDTWVFNCTSKIWTEVTPEISPPERMSQAMVYDSGNGKVLLFSGYGLDGPEVNDTWSYDYTTNTWQEMNPPVSPHARYGTGCVYDDVDETMIIFGGNSGGYFSDTWSYDYSTDTWTELSPMTHPVPLKWASMTYDSVNQKSILFGGDISSPIVSNKTWIFDSAVNEWEESETTIAPSNREACGFTFDSRNEKAILFGGTKGTGQPGDPFNETWAYDYTAGSWTKIEHEIRDIPPPLDPLLVLSTITLGAISLVVVYVYFRKR